VRRGLVVVAAALVLVSVAWAGGPRKVVVTNGNVVHGDPASLAAIDGNTFDIQAEVNGVGRYFAALKAQYGEQPPGTFIVRYSYWTEPVEIPCGLSMTLAHQGRIGPLVAPSGSGTHTGEFERTTSDPGNVGVQVQCAGPRFTAVPYTLHLDLLTVDGA
jgi:hypothetical protein